MLTVAAHDTAGQFVWLWHIYLALTVAVGLLVTAAIVLVAVRYRRRPGRPPRRDPDSAPRVEAVYLLVIAAVVVGLLGATYRTENREDALTAHPAVRVQVTASQWQWQFSYPALHITDVAHNIGSRHPRFARLVVPAGRPVEFRLRSADVLHSFFVPAMRFKRYAFPDSDNRFVLTFPHPGRYLGECAQFCGWDHAEMRFDVVVLTPAGFRAWAAAHAAGAG